MADLSITAASVVLVSGSPFNATAGEAITAGHALYQSAAGPTVKKSQTDGTSAEAAFVGIALNGGGTGQPIVVAGDGCRVTLAGATTAVGVIYYVSNTAGGICPIADIGSADYVTAAGFATDTAGAFTIRSVVTGQTLA